MSDLYSRQRGNSRCHLYSRQRGFDEPALCLFLYAHRARLHHMIVGNGMRSSSSSSRYAKYDEGGGAGYGVFEGDGFDVGEKGGGEGDDGHEDADEKGDPEVCKCSG